jgi:hypothetical protein
MLRQKISHIDITFSTDILQTFHTNFQLVPYQKFKDRIGFTKSTLVILSKQRLQSLNKLTIKIIY